MNNNVLAMLYVLLGVMIFVVFVLIMFLVIIKAKEKKKNNQEQENSYQNSDKTPTKVESSIKVVKEYETKSIFDFMEFEDVKDNMIVQKDGKRFLMAIECQGVNYDLMSDVEKASTEQGFATFLNTLKDPIQIYIQTRTINLESNIQSYKERLTKIKESLDLNQYRLKQYMEKENPNETILKNKKFEILRESNLYEYGRDIIANTERMSLNKNVLKKKYYIIIRYYYEPTDAADGDLLSKDEITEVAFSNLYTRAASMIRVLSGIGIVGKALNSYELVDLLYNAYNRDDSETFGIDKAIDSGFNDIYIDAQSAIDKKIDALNKEIQLKAEQSVKDAIDKVQDERNKELEEIEENIEDIIVDLAKKMLEDENINLPEDVRKKAIKNVEKNSGKKGENKVNVKKETKETSRKRRAV